MNLALIMNPFVDSDVLYAQQLGVTWLVADVPGWDYGTLAAANNRVTKAGLMIASLACLPDEMMRKALLDPPGCDAALADMNDIIRYAGKLGIPSLGYRLPYGFPAAAVTTSRGRGEAISTHYSIPGDNQPMQFTHRESLWEHLTHFLQNVLPTAERASVRLACQTDIATFTYPKEHRILDSLSELELLFHLAPSHAHGLDIDHGFLELAVQDASTTAAAAIHHLGKEKRICAVRLRNVRPTSDGFDEYFLDQDKAKILSALQAYKESGFSGPLCPIAAPGMADDTADRHKGVAFSVGYVRGLLQVLG